MTSMEAELDAKLGQLSMEQLALLYDNMLERKILNGTIDDPVATYLSLYILYYISKLAENLQIQFGEAHDRILIAQFLGEE